MKHKLKYCGIGLFIAGFIFSLGERFDIPYIESSTNTGANMEAKRLEKEIASLNETINTLEEKVQQVNYENKENPKEVDNNTPNKKITDPTGKSESASTGENSDSSTSTQEVITGNIYIYESVSLYDIGRQAEDLKIIENGRQLELFLAKPEYARSIQKGVFELRSNMTLEEMAKILTGKQ